MNLDHGATHGLPALSYAPNFQQITPAGPPFFFAIPTSAFWPTASPYDDVHCNCNHDCQDFADQATIIMLTQLQGLLDNVENKDTPSKSSHFAIALPLIPLCHVLSCEDSDSQMNWLQLPLKCSTSSFLCNSKQTAMHGLRSFWHGVHHATTPEVQNSSRSWGRTNPIKPQWRAEKPLPRWMSITQDGTRTSASG